ncbi:MAG TPA: NAD-dependent epimerase/dehydratase family protein, partial [Ignavibacteriaceae bacterium]|nr:NAD-dependent epimerase/dehydratase family protein [Ignavibacteriaceae bacterium]
DPVYKAAEDVGIKRLIYLSSSSVHGQAPIKGTDENSNINEKQSVPYNNAKALAEKKLFGLRKKGKVELVIFRPGIVYGPRSYWIGNFANSLLRGNAYLIDRGAGICNGIYIDNLVHAILLSITTKQADGNVFLVGDKEQYTWAEIYSPIADALGFDIEKIPEGILPEQKKDWIQYFEKIQNSVIYKYAVRIFPFKFRIAAYTGLTAFLTANEHQSPWKFSTEHSPAATMEMALLYKCQYKFPYKKAKKVLGYEPIISFSEACRRTVEWLGYAGYPINDTLLLEFVRKTC